MRGYRILYMPNATYLRIRAEAYQPDSKLLGNVRDSCLRYCILVPPFLASDINLHNLYVDATFKYRTTAKKMLYNYLSMGIGQDVPASYAITEVEIQ